ncbi:hypothetical protein [Streptomyces sp. NBC_00158]|uniref:hypothetical protein n=1 Tax=Streptomyces sp. NBC_00158 TaxID=2903627 RepID=UPI002F90DE66
MRRSVLATSAAALLSVVAAATLATGTEPGIDWPAGPSVRTVSSGPADGGGVIDWPNPPATPTGTRGGDTDVIDWP